MSTPLALTAYPPIFLELLERFHNGEQRFVLFDHNEKTLKTLRLHFYGFRKACRRAGVDKQYPNLDAISVRVEPGPSLVFELIDANSMFASLRHALDTQGNTTAPVSMVSAPETMSAPEQPSAHEAVLERYLSTPPSVASPPTSPIVKLMDAAGQKCGWPHCQCPPPAPKPCPRWEQIHRERSEGRLSGEPS